MSTNSPTGGTDIFYLEQSKDITIFSPSLFDEVHAISLISALTNFETWQNSACLKN